MKAIFLQTGALLLLIAILVVPSNVAAQTTPPSRNANPTPILPQEAPTTGIDLTVSPVFLNLVTDPGEPVSSSVKVTNNSNITEYLEINLARFVPQATGNPVIADLEENDPFADWASFSEEQFVLAPNETKTIQVTVDPSPDASLGYYYAMVVSRILEQEGSQQSVVAGAPAVPLLLEIRTPNAKREVQLVDFTTDKPFYEYLPTTFVVKLKNTGNIHVAPIGDVFIDSGTQQDIATIPVNYAKGNILPGSEREFTAEWTDGFAVRVPKEENGKVVTDDQGRTVYETKYDFTKADKFRIGKYTANLLLIYDNGERDIPLEATVSFWVIPWKMLGIALIVILLSLLGLRSIVASNVQRFRKKPGK